MAVHETIDRTARQATPAASPLGRRRSLVDKLDALGRAAGQAPWVLAAFDVEGLDGIDPEPGGESPDELVARIGAGLVAAVGRSGTAYRISPRQVAVLARVGRGGEQAILRAARAALTDDAAGVEVVSVATARLPVEIGDPLSALRMIELDLQSPVDRPTGRSAVVDRREPAAHPPAARPSRLPYLRIVTRFRISVLCGALWMALSTWLAWPWIAELADGLTLPLALAIVAGIALIPGYLNVQLISSLLLDRQAPLRLHVEYPSLSLLVAAYDEQRSIGQTISPALGQDYPGELELLVVDDGSTDDTARIARGFASLDDRVSVIPVEHGGKAAALNEGLRRASGSLVATIDADTLLMPGALRRVVARMLQSPDDTVAVAGSVMARNPRDGFVSRAQEWDYFLGIGSIKRQQAQLQATLVAQGAFSVYDAAALERVGGWPDCIGEDIVMTWALLDQGGRTTYEPTAIAFTEVPVTLRALARQRRRWARGMIEGLRSYGSGLLRRRSPFSHSVAADLLFPYLDLTFTLVFIPGIVLAAFGNFAIVGLFTLAVLPLNALLASIMYRRQRRSFDEAGVRVRRNPVGLIGYLVLYQLLLSPVSVAGYTQELLRLGRRW